MNPDRLCWPQSLVLSLLIFCILGTADAAIAQQKREIRPIGCFANVRSEGKRAYGYSVRLWTSYMGIIGIIDYHRGLPDDSPMGVLTDVLYDPVSGKISFEAKLTCGLHYCSKHNGIPSQDLLSFRGLLKADRLEGNLVLKEQLDSPPAVLDEHENFLMRMDDNCRLESYEMYEIWWWYWEPVYNTRGPDW